jgi:hypothetical protein
LPHEVLRRCELSYKGSFTGGRADLSGLTPGTTIWVRVRKIGGWSDPASIMVT